MVHNASTRRITLRPVAQSNLSLQTANIAFDIRVQLNLQGHNKTWTQTEVSAASSSSRQIDAALPGTRLQQTDARAYVKDSLTERVDRKTGV
jgi:hypothetical protein